MSGDEVFPAFLPPVHAKGNSSCCAHQKAGEWVREFLEVSRDGLDRFSFEQAEGTLKRGNK